MGRLLQGLSRLALWRKPKEKLAKGQLNLKSAQSSMRFLSYAPEFKEFVRKNKKVLSSAYKLISNPENMNKLFYWETIRDKEHGIKIRRGWTGKTPGATSLTLKVTLPTKEFFVKITDTSTPKRYLEGIQVADSYLKSKGYKINGFNARVINPLILYGKKDLKSGYSKLYLVTDFYNKGEVIQISDIPKKRAKLHVEAVSHMSSEMYKRNVAHVANYNTFYEPKTNTILFFDLRHD